jgi:Lrp/AsnC family transcriptional regulator for asnA, asnC and gidA
MKRRKNSKGVGFPDQVDRRMIRLLQQDGRMPIASLAKELQISETTARTRLKRLISDRVINIVAVSDPIKLGFEITGNLKISIDLKKKDPIIDRLKQMDQIKYIALTTGGTDLDVDFIAHSLDEFKSLIFDDICHIDGVNSSQTSLILEIVKDAWDYGTAWD